jgi:integrase
MASLWKDSRTPYFVACFTGVSGSRLAQWKRSTFTNDRKLALKITDALEEAARGKRNAETVKAFLAGIQDLRVRRGLHRVFDGLLRKTSGTELEGQTVRAYVEMWLARTKGEISPATWVNYEHKARLFLASLGGKAEHDMAAVKREDITRFRDEQGCRVAASTANQALKIVRVIFAAAETDGVISRNEARLVKKLKVGPEAGNKRRAFTLPELQKLLSVCDEEWRSLVLFGFYTGARLGDLADLTWQNLDLENGDLAYTSRKTRRTVIVPLSNALRAHIEAMPAGDDPRQPIHPRAWGKRRSAMAGLERFRTNLGNCWPMRALWRAGTTRPRGMVRDQADARFRK